jgi:hypothetical protein
MSRTKAVLALLFLVVTAMSIHAQHDRDRLIGAWRLVSLQQPGPDGQLHQVDCSGMFVFTRDGHLAVQVMDRDPHPGSASGPQQYSAGGYEASYGSYTIDEKTHTFTFRVEGALVRSLVGKDLPRHYEFAGRRLTIQSTHPDEHWRVVWEHD